MTDGPKSLYCRCDNWHFCQGCDGQIGPPAAVPSADRKPAVSAHLVDDTLRLHEAITARGLDVGEAAATAHWLSNQLGREFRIADVHPGHVANYRTWYKHYGRGRSLP